MKIKKSTILKTVIFLEIIIIISMFFMSDAQKNPAVLVIDVHGEIVQEIQKIKKPIISVVRDQALSSGYYVAAGTDRIFANELSNIADIGVVQIIEYKPTPNGEYRKCYVSSSDFKRMYYDDCPGFENSQMYIQEKIRLINSAKKMAQEIATFRNLPEEHVLNLADGTVFSGIGALKLGLIDEIGGIHEAVDWLEDELGMELEIVYNREIH